MPIDSQQLERLVDAIADGRTVGALQSRMSTLEARRMALEGELASAAQRAPLLHPNLADIYRSRLDQLAVALETDEEGEARDLIRSLVESVHFHGEAASFGIEVRGELANILGLAAGSPRKVEVLHEQIKMVAGVGFGRQLSLPMVVC